MVKPIDTGSLLVMALTLVLFVIALFTQGFTKDLLLEAGVFLVSVKLILMAHKSSVASAAIQRQLDEISGAVRQLGATTPLAPTLRPMDRTETTVAESGPLRG